MKSESRLTVAYTLMLAAALAVLAAIIVMRPAERMAHSAELAGAATHVR